MRINIVTVYSGWILQKIAERIADALSEAGVDATLALEPRQDCDANFYIDIQNCFHRKTGTLDIGFFSHIHENDIKSLQPHWLHFDFIIHMCQRYYSAFSKFYPVERMAVLYPGEIHGAFTKRRKVTIGVVQRGEYEGKGFFFMLNLFENANPLFREWLHFIFVGQGWSDVVKRYEKLGIEVIYIENESYEAYYKHHQQIDYLLIPSLWEGGPMSLIEAYSQSIPIIAADVGWVPDHFADEEWMMYMPGDTKALLSILERICNKSAARRAVAEKFSYAEYASRLMEITEKLKKEATADRSFLFQGQTFLYFYREGYNPTWQNERAIEIPIIWKEVEDHRGQRILEVGNVLSHYFVCQHEVIDKYEKAPGIWNCDIATFQPSKKYNLIVSISTLEHVGWEETPFDPAKVLVALDNLVTNCLTPGGKLMVTLPLGYNSYLDRLLATGKVNFTKQYYLKRVSPRNEWIEVDKDAVREAKYDTPYPWANAILIGVIEKLGGS